MTTKRILFLFDQVSIEQEKANPVSLCQLLNDAAQGKAEYCFSCYSDLLYSISGSQASITDVKNNWDIADFDLVYQRRWAFASDEAVSCMIYLTERRVPCLDSELRRPGSSGKLSQQFRFWQHELPAPNSVLLPHYHLDKVLAQKNLKKYGISYPLVLKSIDATRGNDNFLAKNIEKAKEIFQKDADKRFLIQQFVPNESDYRVIVGKGKILMTIERTAKAGSHKNNISQGGKAKLRSENIFSKEVKSDIIKAAKAFNREIAGVDIVIKRGTNNHYFFEVNRSPQIEESSFSVEKAKPLHRFFLEMING